MNKEEWSEASFLCPIKALPNLDLEGMGFSVASIEESGKKLLPEEFDSKANVDLLPVVFNLAVVNKFNKNGDGMDVETAIASVKNFANKPINIEHKKDEIVGHILNATLSKDENDFTPQDLESFRGETGPIYIKASGVIYRHIFPKLCSLILEASDPESKEYESISTSWEIGFKKSIFVKSSGSDSLEDAEEIEDEKEIEAAKKCHRAFGGKGKDKKGNSINRIITGRTLPLGAGLTYNPAAAVKGVFVIPDETTQADKDEDKEEKSKAKNSLIIKNAVRIEKFKEILNMNQEQFNQFLQKLEQSAASVLTEESQAKSVGLIMKDALTEYGKTWQSQVDAEKQAAAKTKEDLDALQTSFQSVKSELDQIKQQNEVKAAAELFNNRMNFVEANYVFTEDELKLVTNEVKSIASSEEAFDSYKEKLSVLFSHKSKASVKEQEEEIKRKVEEEVQKRLQESQASTQTSTATEVGGSLEEVEASATATIPNASEEASKKESLVEKLKKSFSVKVTQ